MEMEKKIRGRPKQKLTDDVKRNLQIRQHNYYVNYKNKKNKSTKPELAPVPEELPIQSTLQESLNNIIKIIDGIKASFSK